MLAGHFFLPKCQLDLLSINLQIVILINQLTENGEKCRLQFPRM